MTFPLIANIVFAALVLVTIPGMLAWSIYASRKDGTPPARAVRRPMPHPVHPSPRVHQPHRPARRPAADTPGR